MNHCVRILKVFNSRKYIYCSTNEQPVQYRGRRQMTREFAAEHHEVEMYVGAAVQQSKLEGPQLVRLSL